MPRAPGLSPGCGRGRDLKFSAGTHTEALARVPLPKLDGEYQGEFVWLSIATKGDGYAGTVKVQGKEMNFTAREIADEVAGTVGEGTNAIPFTLVRKGAACPSARARLGRPAALGRQSHQPAESPRGRTSRTAWA